MSLWHLLFRESALPLPNALFMGGALAKGYLALFRRPLRSPDFMNLWSVSSIGAGNNIIGTEYAMDLSEVGRLPISSDRPAGSDIRYDPAFDDLQTEVDKLSSPALAGSVDWEKVCRFAADILTNKSKDLLVASYLSVALIHTRGSDGFAMGLKLYLDMMERFWEELFPSKVRLRGRVRAVEWWVEKADTALAHAPELSFPPAQTALIRGNLNRPDIFVSEHLENAPSLAAVKDRFSSPASAGEGPCRHESGAADAGQSPDGHSPTPPSHGEAQEVSRYCVSPREVREEVNEGLRLLREAASQLFQRDPAAPVAYRLSRNAAWCGIEELPPVTNGRTRITPPATVEKNLLSDLRNRSDAEALLKAAEARLPQYIFWLDLNRLTVEALSRLGNRFGKAQEAVCQETACLLHRFPGLEELAFSDGTPFATPETRQWLEGIVFRGTACLEPLATTDERVAEGALEAAIAQGIAEMQVQVRQGKLVEAMEEMQRRLRGCTSKRERFFWRLELAGMLTNAGRSRLALPHLDQVLRDMERHELEEYDPLLAMRGLKLAWHALQCQGEQRYKDMATDVLHRIGRLDMPEMMRLKAES